MNIEIELTDIAQGGAAVGRWHGRVVFAAGGLPGELVRVRLNDAAALDTPRSFLRGEVTEVLRPSPDRVPPRLPGADHIPWQHIAYPAQLRFKEQILAEQLAKLARLDDAPIRPMLAAASPWGYRNSAHMHADGSRIGYYAAGSRTVIELAEDPLLLPVLNEALAGLRAVLEDGRRAMAAEQDERGPPSIALSGVTLRGSATYGYAIAALYGRGNLARLAARWRERVPALAGVDLAALHDEQGGGRRAVGSWLSPTVTLLEDLDDVVFDLGVASFFQAHTAQAARMLELVRAGLGLRAGERLLDAYSGAGTFALPLAAGLSEVVAVEESHAAVADGRRSAILNGITNVSFVAAPVEHALVGLEPPFAAAVVDPPRRGCHPAALQALIRLAPPRLAYISCHPGILARDLQVLLEGGYRLVWIQPIDLFPQTPHIESIALLER